MGNPTVNSSELHCDIIVSSGNLPLHAEIQFPALIRDLRIIPRLPEPTEGPLLQPRAARPQIAFGVGSL